MSSLYGNPADHTSSFGRSSSIVGAIKTIPQQPLCSLYHDLVLGAKEPRDQCAQGGRQAAA